jgi:hypothetical protein
MAAPEMHNYPPLTFEELPGKQVTRVAEYLNDADVKQTDRYDEFVGW